MAQQGFRPVRILAINGRNAIDSPLDPQFRDLAQEAINVDRYEGLLGRKRGGATNVATTGGTAFTGSIVGLHRFVPGVLQSAAELFGVDGTSGIVKRMAGGTSFANVTLADAITGELPNTQSVTLGGKLFFACKTAQDRLHCYDPSLASPQIRRVGIAPGSNAPTVANTGAGAYAATARYYRVRFIQVSGTVIVRRSEPTPTSASFTPSGAGTAARVTRPTAPGEGETHWEVEGSSDGTFFYRIAGTGGVAGAVAIATTTYDDSTVVTSYSLYPLSDKTGTYTLPWSARYLVSDGSRLVFAGDFSNTYSSSFGWTPVKGDLSAGDDERMVVTNKQKNYSSLGENDGDYITGMVGPLNKGIIYIFKYSQIWQLTPTGDNLAPYLQRRITDQVGCIDFASISIGRDEMGNACVYFMSLGGPYRIGMGGLQYLGRDVEDLCIESSGGSKLSLDATIRVALSLWVKGKNQWWVWIATGTDNTPSLKLVFDANLGRVDENGRVRRGWFVHNGPTAAVVSAVSFANTLGASMSKDLKPYLGLVTAATIYKADTTDTSDNGTAFQAYIKPRPIIQSEDLYPITGCSRVSLVAKVATAVTIQLSLWRDFGKSAARTFTQTLTAIGSETRTTKDFPDSSMTEAYVLELQIGDASAVASAWVLDELIIPVTVNEART